MPGGFTADPDVLDTWATSSLTPQLLGGWSRDEDFFGKVFPFDLRPQGHDIIRTWLFSTVVRANSLNDCAPWKHAGLSGWILDPDRKKMSKSKGNVVVPSDILAESKPGFGPDAVRYWAASAKLGADTAYDVTQMQIGRRLAMKLLNASKFALAQGVHAGLIGQLGAVTHDLDRALLAKLSEVVDQAGAHMADYDYAHALRVAESFFWEFTDDYVELVKDRSYGASGSNDQTSAHVTLATALDVLLRLFAPIMPFVTEEVWSWWRTGSVHRAPWPSDESLCHPDSTVDPELLASVAAALTEIRRTKTEAKLSQKTPVATVTIQAPTSVVSAIRSAEGDLKAAGRIETLAAEEAGEEIAISNISFVEQA